MSKNTRKSLAGLLLFMLCLLGLPVSAMAADKGYTITSGNTKVYSNTALTKSYGTIYGSDEVTINYIADTYVKVTYPTTKGRTKTGYIRTSALFTAMSGWEYTARAKTTTYRRPGGSSYGYVAKGDKVLVLGESGGYTQLRYPTSTGNKFAFVKNADLKDKITGTSGEDKPASATTYYVTTKAGLVLRSSASTSSSRVTSMPYKAAFSVTSTKNGWAYGTYNGKTGYASLQYLSTTKPSDEPAGGGNKTITVYSQHDSRWANVSYGKCNGSEATLSSSGCGILAYVNAVYYMNGRFIQPETLARWSVEHGYRINDAGTSHDLYEAYAKAYGASYGFKYAGTASSVKNTRTHLQNGGVAVIGVPGHLMALVDYDSKTGKYLILDSYRATSRGTYSTGYRWLTSEEFTGKLAVSDIKLLARR